MLRLMQLNKGGKTEKKKKKKNNSPILNVPKTGNCKKMWPQTDREKH